MSSLEGLAELGSKGVDISTIRQGTLFKIFFIVIVVGAAIVAVCAKLAATAPDGSNTKSAWLDVPEVIALGHVRPGKYKKSIEIANPGDEPVTIIKTESGCSCTVADLDVPRTIRPGEKIYCSVSLDASRFGGDVRKRVTFHARRGAQSAAYSAVVMAFVERAVTVQIDPPTLDFGRFGCWERASANVNVYSMQSTALRLDTFKPVVRGLRLELLSENASALTANLLIAPGSISDGSFRFVQEIATNKGDVGLEMRGHCYAEMYTTSTGIVFTAPADGHHHMERAVEIHHAPAVDPSAITVRADVGTAQVSAVDIIRDTTARLRITLNSAARTPKRGRLSFTTPNGSSTLAVEYFVRSM